MTVGGLYYFDITFQQNKLYYNKLLRIYPRNDIFSTGLFGCTVMLIVV